MDELIQMARAAQHDDRLADGSLYGRLADKLEQAKAALREADIYLSGLLAEVSDRSIQRGMRTTLSLIDAAKH